MVTCGCGKHVEEERVEYGFKNCAACAHAGPDVSRPKGRMVYGHKTGAEIEILTEESWNENKKYFSPKNINELKASEIIDAKVPCI